MIATEHRCPAPALPDSMTQPYRPDWECGQCGRLFTVDYPWGWVEVRGPADTEVMQDAEAIAKAFHEAYERRKPNFLPAPNWEMADGTGMNVHIAVPWDEVPEENRKLMIAVAQELMDRRVISPSGWRTPFGFER